MSGNTALPTRRPLSTREKTISILADSSVILAMGAYCYWINKKSFNFALGLFDHIVNILETPVVDYIVDVIETLTEKKTEKKTE